MHVAVIGAGFGDEGKGQTVDWLANQGNHDLVVRFNGGSQCGHTVVDPNGQQHIFAQIGAGAGCGLPTHLSRFTYINPIYLMRELMVFKSTWGFYPKISVDPRTNIVVPQDVAVNRETERFRGRDRHGSTGHGIFTAVNRSFDHTQRLPACNCFHVHESRLVDFFEKTTHDAYRYSREYDRDLSEFIYSVKFCNDHIKLNFDHDVIRDKTCIFEGGQGLLLDQNSGFFPHVTPSNTGLTNVMSLLIPHGGQLQPIYVTRTFVTRHGAGPLYYAQFDHAKNYLGFEASDLADETNCHNEWQGSMRYGQLVPQQLEFAVKRDFYFAAQLGHVALDSPTMCVTWANKFPDVIDKITQLFSQPIVAAGRTRADMVDFRYYR